MEQTTALTTLVTTRARIRPTVVVAPTPKPTPRKEGSQHRTEGRQLTRLVVEPRQALPLAKPAPRLEIIGRLRPGELAEAVAALGPPLLPPRLEARQALAGTSLSLPRHHPLGRPRVTVAARVTIPTPLDADPPRVQRPVQAAPLNAAGPGTLQAVDGPPGLPLTRVAERQEGVPHRRLEQPETVGEQLPTVRTLPRVLPTTRATRRADTAQTTRQPTLLVLPTNAAPHGLLKPLKAVGQDAVGEQLMANGRVTKAHAVAKPTLAAVLPALPLRVRVRQVRARRRTPAPRRVAAAKLVTIPRVPLLALPSPGAGRVAKGGTLPGTTQAQPPTTVRLVAIVYPY